MSNTVTLPPPLNLHIAIPSTTDNLFLGSTGTPIYDNAQYVRTGIDIPDMLVRNTHLGAALASHFSTTATATATAPDHTVVLMRGHGMTVLGLQDCVLRAIYPDKCSNPDYNTVDVGCVAGGVCAGGAGSDRGDSLLE